MRTFIAHRVSGEPIGKLRSWMTEIQKALLRNAEIEEAYCTFLDLNVDPDALGPGGTMQHAFSVIRECDFLFVLQFSKEKSEGMLMEVGFAYGINIPVVVATHIDLIDTYVPKMADKLFRWIHVYDLCEQLAYADFSAYRRHPRPSLRVPDDGFVVDHTS